MNNQFSAPAQVPEAPALSSSPISAPIMVSPPHQETAIPIYDFGEANLEQPAIEEPSTSLMGMMDANGREHIEYPANSGRLWYRDNPDSAWVKN